MTNPEVVLADYTHAGHASAIISLLDHYACDPMGGGEGLPARVLENLVPALDAIEGAFSVLAFVDDKAVGLVNCFQGFSTFQCRPLVNIHDVVVLGDFRGRGISRLMLQTVENVARERGCCKLTLEVLSGNHVAMAACRAFGFADYQLDAAAGTACFWEKKL